MSSKPFEDSKLDVKDDVNLVIKDPESLLYFMPYKMHDH